jgi:hypothetical protein
MFEKEAETRDVLLSLADSTIDACSCVAEVQRFRTSDQLKARLKELQPLVNDACNFVNVHHSRPGTTGTAGIDFAQVP